MTLGVANKQGDLLDDVTRFCDETLEEHSIYAFLHRERDRLFPDEAFADLFETRADARCRPRSSPWSWCSSASRASLTARRSSAIASTTAGATRPASVAMTPRVDELRPHRPRRHARAPAPLEQPNRIFDVTRDAAKEAGLVGRKRVLDSTPLYDAVATMDTVTLIRSAIRGVLKVADPELAADVREAMKSGDDYATRPSPRSTGTTPPPVRPSSTAGPRTPTPVLLVLEGKELGPALSPGRHSARHRGRPRHRRERGRHLSHRARRGG